MKKDIEKVLYSSHDLARIIKRLGKQISEDYKDKNLLLVSILKGSVVTMADLMRAITIPCAIDFMVVSSYGSGTTTSGSIKIIKDLDIDISQYDLLIVEDILDSGVTLNALRDILSMRNPKSIKICTLLDKPDRRVLDIKADYIGTRVPNAFIVGYGLDYGEKYRNLPYIGILKPSVYENKSAADASAKEISAVGKAAAMAGEQIGSPTDTDEAEEN